MSARDRRLGFRIPLEIFLNQYIDDQPFRALTSNLSDTGLFVQVVRNPFGQSRIPPAGTSVQLEFELPGTGEIIWARGEICDETGARWCEAEASASARCPGSTLGWAGTSA